MSDSVWPHRRQPTRLPIPGILQARTLEWVAISFSNAGKWKVKGKSLSPVQLLATPWTTAYQAPLSMGFSRQEYWSWLPLSSPMSTAALFISVKAWKQPRCPAVGEWINKLWYIQTTEYYSALKRNELSSYERSRQKLRYISSERSQCEKASWFKLYDILGKMKLWRE